MRHRLLAVAILSSLALPAFGADSAPGSSPGQALHCGKLFDSRSGKLLGAHTVVVRDGKVAEVLAGRADAGTDENNSDLASHSCIAGSTDLNVHAASNASVLAKAGNGARGAGVVGAVIIGLPAVAAARRRSRAQGNAWCPRSGRAGCR